MLRISKLTDYGTLVLAHLDAGNGAVASAVQLAERTGLAPPTVSKILKSLAKSGLVTSERGPHGGYVLARAPAAISAAEIIDALEGPVALTECSSPAGTCDLEAHCRVGSAWQNINRTIREALHEVSLEDLQHLPRPMPSPKLKAGLRAATG